MPPGLATFPRLLGGRIELESTCELLGGQSTHSADAEGPHGIPNPGAGKPLWACASLDSGSST